MVPQLETGWVNIQTKVFRLHILGPLLYLTMNMTAGSIFVHWDSLLDSIFLHINIMHGWPCDGPRRLSFILTYLGELLDGEATRREIQFAETSERSLR